MSAGESIRFRHESKIKKHWIRYNNQPLWLYVANSLQHKYNFNKVIVTASSEDLNYMQKFCSYNIVEGGKNRQDSLSNALNLVNTEFVAVSDAARFRLDFDVLDKLFNYDLSDLDCLIPVLNISDTIFFEENNNKNYINRDSVKLVQTPQISRVVVLKEAIKLGNFSDESSAINNFGGKIVTIKGSHLLDKLTYFNDLKECDLKSNCDNPSVFIGYGFDVHKFTQNKKMFLGGVEIDCDFGLEAHSDGDVVLHSLCDAILGAIGAGDIGEWFPDSDNKYKNLDSKILLQTIVDFVFSVGFKIINIDIMIMAQIPKILMHKEQMILTISNILELQKNYVNIKATTMEKMGFIGREEGICVSSTASLKLH